MSNGSGKALTDPTRNKQIVKELMFEKSPIILGNYLEFITKHFDGVSDIEQFDKEGNVTDTMSKSAIEKMKLAHKMATKIIDKITPTSIIIENNNNAGAVMDPRLQNALILIADKARLEAEMEAEDKALNEVQALEVRTMSRSEERG